MKVLITGASGQDGYFLSKYFHRNKLKVIGTVRCPPNSYEPWRFRYFDEVIQADLRSPNQLVDVIAGIRPDYVVNLAALSDSWSQFENPDLLFEVNLSSVLAMLEYFKSSKASTVFVQASSSEVFAGGKESPQTLDTCRMPRSLYGASKIAADNAIDIYRKQYGINCYSVILFSHESPLRRDGFYSKKVVHQALDVVEGKSSEIQVYTPTAIRDWGYAGEYCKFLAAHILEGKIQNVMLGSGQATSVRKFAQYVCDALGLVYANCVVEHPALEGRAMEDVPIVADSGCDSFIGDGLKVDVKALVDLLVRYARYGRNSQG